MSSNFLNDENKGDIVIYQSESGETKIDVRFQDETVWLTQQQIAELFGTQRPAITKHLANIYKSGELDKNSTCSILEHMGNEGLQRYKTKFYNLDAILSVGYRVNSINATLFRHWANRVLKEYLLKGYSIHNRIEKLEQRVTTTENKIDFFVRTSLPPVEGIFFDGQVFDARRLAETHRPVERVRPRLVAHQTRKAMGFRPSSVSVHDDGQMAH